MLKSWCGKGLRVRMVRSVYWACRSLQGLFAVYKPPGVHWKLVRDMVETNLVKELNALEQPMPRHQVRFLPAGTEGADGVQLSRVATAVPILADHVLELNALEQPTPRHQVRILPAGTEGADGVQLSRVATAVPVLADHVLVKGALYTHLKVGAGHRLDYRSSGVFVLGLGRGNQLLNDMYNSHSTRDYTVSGLFGKATDDFSDTGKVIEKTTYDHITRDKLERILAVIQGSNQKAMLMHTRINLKSQEAYELAVEGHLRPMVKSPPIILGMRCLEFSPPHFTLEIQCMHETQQYLRKLIHEIGLELRSSAVCTKVRRTRDGPFTADCALLRTHCDLQNISRALKENRGRAAELIRMNISNLERQTRNEEKPQG